MQAVTHPFQLEETLTAGTRTESYLWEVAVMSRAPDSNDHWQILDVRFRKKASFILPSLRQLFITNPGMKQKALVFIVFGFICCRWVQDAVSWRRRLQTKPYHSHPRRLDEKIMSFVFKPTAAQTSPQYFLLFLLQTSMNVKNCLVCVRGVLASTHLAVSSVNVQEVLHWTWKPESAKVWNVCTYMYPPSQAGNTHRQLIYHSHFIGLILLFGGKNEANHGEQPNEKEHTAKTI